jgi:hypothetical protein
MKIERTDETETEMDDHGARGLVKALAGTPFAAIADMLDSALDRHASAGEEEVLTLRLSERETDGG